MRRAGLARFATIAGALGMALASVTGARVLGAVVGLAVSLAGALWGMALSRSRPASSVALGAMCASIICLALFSGLLVGGLRVAAVLDGGLRAPPGSIVETEVVVTGAVRSNAGWQSASAELRGSGDKLFLEIAPARDGVTSPALFQGAILAVRGTLQAPKGPTASGFDQARFLLHQGILTVLRVDASGAATLVGRRGGVAGWFDRLRSSAKAHLSLGPDDRISEVLEGVVMGETTGIDGRWAEAFRRAGTAHMLSVSGLHVASLAAIVIGLAGALRLSRRTGSILAAAAAFLMIPFVGVSPPIVRAAVMIAVVLGGRLVGRGRDHWQGLAFAAAVVLAINPFAVFDVGFQLSFGALAGIMAFTGRIQRRLTRLPPEIAANLAVSIAATVGTAPASLAVFGRASLVAPVANLLVVPALPLVTGLGMASVFTGFLWSGFSVALDTLSSLPLSWAIMVSRFFAAAPVLGAHDLGRALLAAGSGAVAVPVALALRGRTSSLPGRLRLPFFRRTLTWVSARRPRDRRRATAAAIAVVLCAGLLGALTYPALALGMRSAEALLGARGWPDGVEVRMLDVGQGTAVLVRTPGRHAMLFDAGPSGCGLAGQLRSLGVHELDLVVVSHPHLDHFGGLLEAAGEIDVRVFVDRAQVVAGPEAADGCALAAGAPRSREAMQYLELRSALQAEGSRCLAAGPGWSLSVDGVNVRLFAPSRPLVLVDGVDPWARVGGPPSGDELNGGSLVALLSAGEVDFLLPGDAEADVLDRYDLPPTEVLVVAHHGSRGAVSADLLHELGSLVALVPVGERNSFGHPDPDTMSLLEAAVPTILRSDRHGWVSCRVTDGVLTIGGERMAAP